MLPVLAYCKLFCFEHWGVYDLTFNWNTINERKSKQNISRDIEIKNIVTISTEEWGEDGGGRGSIGAPI